LVPHHVEGAHYERGRDNDRSHHYLRLVERRGGHPARVSGTGKAPDSSDGVLRIDFAEPDKRLERVSWDDFFKAFDENRLALPYQNEPSSRFSKLVSRDYLYGRDAGLESRCRCVERI
jgi:hypothetical protein